VGGKHHRQLFAGYWDLVSGSLKLLDYFSGDSFGIGYGMAGAFAITNKEHICAPNQLPFNAKSEKALFVVYASTTGIYQVD
jgi:hypothetical protein